MSNSQLLAVIPARGGSKRIPHKNIKEFLGKPLISYSIQAALESKLFSDVIVSTDDPEIAETAQKCGASVPFMRNSALADDFTGTGPVTLDAYKRMQALGKDYAAVCTIYATAPLLTAKHLCQAYQKYTQDEADYIFSCCEYPFPIQRAFYMDEAGSPIAIMPEFQASRSQDLRKAYQDAGQFYIYSPRYLQNFDTKVAALSPEQNAGYIMRAYEMPRYRVIDIDTPEDWEYAVILAHAVHSLKRDD